MKPITKQDKWYMDELAKSGLFIFMEIKEVKHRPNLEEVERSMRDVNGEVRLFDRVLFVQLTQNVTKDQADAELKLIADKMKEEGIDGFALMETPEKYRIR